uniref:Uncharacterized protein n=1 Tax=Fagus sylvatica TaxID=28930 RepID=A0A2N9F7H6_FAGSY
MALRSDDRKLSFEILSRSMSLEEDEALFFYRSNSNPIKNGVVGFAIGGDDAASWVGDNEKEESGVEVSSTAKQPNGREREKKRRKKKKGEGIN